MKLPPAMPYSTQANGAILDGGTTASRYMTEITRKPSMYVISCDYRFQQRPAAISAAVQPVAGAAGRLLCPM